MEIKNAGDLVMSNDEKTDVELPKQLAHKNFNNNVYLRILQLTNNMHDCPDDQKRRELKLDLLDLINEYTMILNDTISDLKSYNNMLSSVYAIEHEFHNLASDIGNEENIVSYEHFYDKTNQSEMLNYVLNKILVDSNNMEYDFQSASLHL